MAFFGAVSWRFESLRAQGCVQSETSEPFEMPGLEGKSATRRSPLPPARAQPTRAQVVEGLRTTQWSVFQCITLTLTVVTMVTGFVALGVSVWAAQQSAGSSDPAVVNVIVSNSSTVVVQPV